MAQQYIEIVCDATLTDASTVTKPIVNVFHFRRTSTLDPVVKANIEAAFNSSIGAAMLAACSVDYEQSGNRIRFIDDALDPYVIVARSGVGAISTDRQPSYDAVTMQLRTGVRGRFARGSKHFAGVAEAHTTGNILTGSGVTLWGAVRDAIAAGFTDSDGNVWVPGVNSHQPPAQWTANPVVMVWNDVTQVLLNLTLGTMRRRKVKTVV